MEKTRILCAILACIIGLSSCDSKDNIKPIKTETGVLDLSEAEELVEEGERIIVELCEKDAISRDEYGAFNSKLDSIYNNYFNGEFGQLFFYNTEYEDPQISILHVKKDVFYPTSLHKGISVVSANIVSQYFENDFYNDCVLTIREEYSGSDKQLSGFYREYIYKKNDNGKWDFYGFGGTGNYTGEGYHPKYLDLKSEAESPAISSDPQKKGTDDDKQKEQEHYFMSALNGEPEGLYKLASSNGISRTQFILFSKAASSMDYSPGYFDIAYGGLEGYSAKESKMKVIEKLSDAWDKETDPAAVQLKNSIRGNQYFSKEFAEALVKTSYTYSYYAFAEKYGIGPNQSFEDAKTIEFVISQEGDEFDSYGESMAEQYLEYEDCEFYRLDFDGDGNDEIGVPLHSGAGGAFMADGFGIFKKNKDGLYERYASGPDCTLRDGMRLIEYENRIYFIVNPFSDTMNEPHNILARVIDEDGKGHEISINCSEYKPKEIMTKVYDGYDSDEFSSFLTGIMSQVYEAIAATKKREMYNPNTTKQVKSSAEQQDDFYVAPPTDVYFAADINNDGTKEYIRKGHIITELKYYNDYNLFQIYNNESELAENAVPMLDILPQGDYYGLHSVGNLYDVLPVEGKIVQFWTREKDGRTYCIALTRNELLYSLQVYEVQNKKAVPVCHSLLFDEVQSVDLVFSND